MANFYCDNTNGNDTTGDGSPGNPYKTLNKITQLSAGISTSGGNVIYVANTSAQASATWSATWLANDGVLNPTIILPWDNGGSLTLTTPNGQEIVAWELNAAGATTCLSGALLYLTLLGGILHNTSSFVVDGSASISLINCKLYDGSGVAVVDGTVENVIGCWIIGNLSVQGQDGLEAVSKLCFGNYFQDISATAVRGTGANTFILMNVFKNCCAYTAGGAGDYMYIDCPSDNYIVMYNTLIGHDGTGGGGGTPIWGVYIGPASDGGLYLFNLLTDFEAASQGYGFYGTGIGHLLAFNHFYNMTSGNESTSVAAKYANTTESSHPLTDPDNGDYTVKVTADAYQRAVLNPTGQKANIGANQVDLASGVGGGPTYTPLLAG